VELGECFNTQGDYRIALRVLAEVARQLQKEPGNIELRLRALYAMATAHEQLSESDEAIRCLEQILVLKHNYLDSRARLESLYDNREHDKAKPEPVTEEKGDTVRGEIISEILDMLGVPEEPQDEGGAQ
jgi:tetratricopeptide (TPR) repeat protein